MLTERMCAASFQSIVGENNIYNHVACSVSHYLLQLSIDLIRSGSYYSISIGNGNVQYYPIGRMHNKYPQLYTFFRFKFYTKANKIVFWNLTMENPIVFATMKFFTYHFSTEWIDISEESDQKQAISKQLLPIELASFRSSSKSNCINNLHVYVIFNYILIALFSIFKLRKIKIPKKLKFCRFIYSHNYLSFVISAGVQLFFIFFFFFLLTQFFNKNINSSKMMIHFLIIFLLTSPLNGYVSYRLFIGTLNHFMLLQICLWFFEIGSFSLIYCIVCIIKTRYFQSDREMGVIAYFFISFLLSLLGSSFSHPLIAFLNKQENSEIDSKSQNFYNNQLNHDEILHKSGFKKIEIKSDNVEEEIVDTFEKDYYLNSDDDQEKPLNNGMNDLIFDEDEDDEEEDDSEIPFINQTNKKSNKETNSEIPFIQHSKIEYRRSKNSIKIPFSHHPLLRCILNSFLISISFSAEFLFLIQYILLDERNFSCIFILLDFISSLLFSVYINSYQIRKQIKFGNVNASSLFTSTLLSGPFLLIFSLFAYDKYKDKNPFLSFRCFVSISTFFCISISFIFSSLTFVIIFALFIYQHKARNNAIIQSI